MSSLYYFLGCQVLNTVIISCGIALRLGKLINLDDTVIDLWHECVDGITTVIRFHFFHIDCFSWYPLGIDIYSSSDIYGLAHKDHHGNSLSNCVCCFACLIFLEYVTYHEPDTLRWLSFFLSGQRVASNSSLKLATVREIRRLSCSTGAMAY